MCIYVYSHIQFHLQQQLQLHLELQLQQPSNSQDEVCRTLGIPGRMTAFADLEIEVLKQMLFDIRYVKGKKSVEFVSKVVKDSVGDGDKDLIAFFSGFLPGARKSGNLSLVKSYKWKLMAFDYNQPIFFASLQKLEVVSFAGPRLLEPIVIPVADVGTKEGNMFETATKQLSLRMLAKHTRRADALVARGGNDADRAQHQARQSAFGPVSGSVAAAQTVLSRATSFNPGTLPQGVNREVVAARLPTAEVAASTPQTKPRAKLICPLCKEVVSGGKKKYARGVSRHLDECVFDLFVSKFSLGKYRVPGGNSGFLKSQCLWIGWQDNEWIEGVSAALRREKKGESTVFVESRGVKESTNGALAWFALPLSSGASNSSE
jgi:hypothetical protein